MEDETHVEAIAALGDNYIWGMSRAGRAVLVDPGEAAPAAKWLAASGLELAAILVTHRHSDHVAGIGALLDGRPKVRVFAPAAAGIRHATDQIAAGTKITPAGTGLEFSVIATPGHTAEHVSYVSASHVYCGDALFSCGCGRLFEGGGDDLLTSMSAMRELPGTMLACCGHEYTRSNIRFALAVEPGNEDLRRRGAEVERLLRDGLPTLPVSIASEQRTNPFMRYDKPAVRAAACARAGRELTEHAEVLAELRAWKDRH